MVFITLNEIIDIVFMTFAIGFIFSDIFKREPLEGYDPLKYYSRTGMWENIKFAAMIAAPAVVLHELAHKFVALGFGAQATLHAPYTIYMIVILLKLVRFPLLFFVGGYVAHTLLPPLESAAVSIVGPLTNLAIWLSILAIVRFNLVNKKYYRILEPMAKLNMFLFIFNMIPLPGFDGYNFLSSLFSAFA
jgi:Zn-dependent protease|tara:strand:+ start:496 stop:1065 length:570 start_codon:yes stop_codon:yes gene_type:complete